MIANWTLNGYFSYLHYWRGTRVHDEMYTTWMRQNPRVEKFVYIMAFGFSAHWLRMPTTRLLASKNILNAKYSYEKKTLKYWNDFSMLQIGCVYLPILF